MRYFLETYGCQMNKAESSALEVQCAEHGWLKAATPEEADLVLINTCSVRISAENRAWGRISHYVAKKRERHFFLVVTGCMAERLKESMRVKQPAIDYVLGNFQKQAFSLVLDAAARGERLPVVEESPEFSFAPSHLEPGAFRAYVTIMHGCNKFCSYCNVPYVRGRESSRDPAAVLHEIGELAERGIREVTLLGQNVNSYRWEGGESSLDFPSLLRVIADKARGTAIQRIRFVSSHPKDLSEDTIRVIAEDSLFARHIHLCVQHGSDTVLAAMNRKYTRASYLELVAKMRASIPELTLSTDILMGFPGETEEDVQDTLSLMSEVRFAYAYMYFFNPREGTPAVKLPGALPDAIKKERLARVIALQRGITRELMKGYVGSVREVLVEAVSKKREGEMLGRTDQDMMAVFPAPQSRIGSFVRVRLNALRGVTFSAEEVL